MISNSGGVRRSPSPRDDGVRRAEAELEASRLAVIAARVQREKDAEAAAIEVRTRRAARGDRDFSTSPPSVGGRALEPESASRSFGGGGGGALAALQALAAAQRMGSEAAASQAAREFGDAATSPAGARGRGAPRAYIDASPIAVSWTSSPDDESGRMAPLRSGRSNTSLNASVSASLKSSLYSDNLQSGVPRRRAPPQSLDAVSSSSLMDAAWSPPLPSSARPVVPLVVHSPPQLPSPTAADSPRSSRRDIASSPVRRARVSVLSPSGRVLRTTPARPSPAQSPARAISSNQVSTSNFITPPDSSRPPLAPLVLPAYSETVDFQSVSAAAFASTFALTSPPRTPQAQSTPDFYAANGAPLPTATVSKKQFVDAATSTSVDETLLLSSVEGSGEAGGAGDAATAPVQALRVPVGTAMVSGPSIALAVGAKKSALGSIVKGIAGALGLRKTRKQREQEAAAKADAGVEKADKGAGRFVAGAERADSAANINVRINEELERADAVNIGTASLTVFV